MGIIQNAIAALIAPQLAPINQAIAELQQRPALSAEDRVALDKASAMVAELEALADGTIVVEPPAGESVTVPGLNP